MQEILSIVDSLRKSVTNLGKKIYISSANRVILNCPQKVRQTFKRKFMQSD